MSDEGFGVSPLGVVAVWCMGVWTDVHAIDTVWLVMSGEDGREDVYTKTNRGRNVAGSTQRYGIVTWTGSAREGIPSAWLGWEVVCTGGSIHRVRVCGKPEGVSHPVEASMVFRNG